MSLFGNSQAQQAPSGSLFGASTAKPSLFGNSTATSQPQQSGGLFGGLSNNQNQNQNQSQSQQSGNSLFQTGNNQSAQNSNPFGQTQTQQQQQPQQQQQQQQSSGGGLFGGFGASTNQNSNTLGNPLLQSTNQQPQNMAQSRLGMSVQEAAQKRERSIPDQMEIILKKWSPESRDCLMQKYFYNAVRPGTAYLWAPGPEDDEQKWEEALSKRPSDDTVPLLLKGFAQLGSRLQTQVQAVQQLQSRLHEMNNSLDAMMQKHELSLSVRAAEAKRKHIGLSQKCLSLAIKVQVLRSRGFVLDAGEEELKKKLAVLEKGVFDPGFAGREEEIWARMVALRERTRWLQAESEKLGRQVANGEQAGINEEILRKTKKILSDYDAQITHLRKELEQVQHEYQEWEAATRPS